MRRDYYNIGWQPHELLWVEAANTLVGPERAQAMRDIALMTQRTQEAVERRAYKLRVASRDAMKAAALKVALTVPNPRPPYARAPLTPREVVHAN